MPAACQWLFFILLLPPFVHMMLRGRCSLLDFLDPSPQEDRIHKVELFVDKVVDSLFSFSCAV